MVSFSSSSSLEALIACPCVLRRARVYIGSGCLLLVILPAVISSGIGERMWAPSMPPLALPSSRLSRVTAQEVCLTTLTSGMPCLAKSPFSLAMISGALSVRAMKPRVAPFTSGASGPVALLLVEGLLLPQAASQMAPAAEPAAVIRNLRRDRFDMTGLCSVR